MTKNDDLAAVLSEFARTLVTDFPIQGILDHLVARIVDLMPIDAAGVSLITPTSHPRLVAGSDESAIRYEHLQTILGEGPCLAAYETDVAISIPDLAASDRFPTSSESALAEGLVAVFTFPLRNDDRCLGALDLYRTTAGALDAHDMTTAQTLADVATAYLLNAESRLAKNEFVTTVSHELRTPMTSIAGFVELLQDGAEGPLSTGQEGLVDVCTVVRAAQQTLLPLIGRRELAVTFEVPLGPVRVQGNVVQLEAMVVNLMTNALKFTPDGGWVNCELRSFAGTARLAVSDNGLGIPQPEQRNLFTKFFRSTTAQEHAIQGTGLGLTIVDSIIRSHGGDITVESDHLEGSTFTVNLPLAQGAPRTDLALVP